MLFRSATMDFSKKTEDMKTLLDVIVDYIPAPKGDENAPFKLLISTTDYNEYVGRIGIGKIESGSVKLGDDAVIVNYNDSSINKKIKITKIYEFENLSRKEVESSSVGNIIAVTGVEGISIGDTLCSLEDVTPLPFVKISEPTLAMNFIVNNSPFAGKE